MWAPTCPPSGEPTLSRGTDTACDTDADGDAAPVVFPVADGITAIDTFMGGRARLHGRLPPGRDRDHAWSRPAPGRRCEPVAAALDHLGVAADELAHIVLTHIHLDHAGGVGQLAERFPRATVWVHHRGAPHLVDPTRLVASTARVWGEAEMRELFGPTVAGRAVTACVRSRTATTIALGDRELRGPATRRGTPRTTWRSSTHAPARCSPATRSGSTCPTCPCSGPRRRLPSSTSSATSRRSNGSAPRQRSILLFAHFGPLADVDATCELAIRRVRDWAGVVEGAVRDGDDPDELAARLESAALADIETGAEATLDLEMLEDRLRLLSSIRMNAQGLARYWQQAREAGDAPPGTALADLGEALGRVVGARVVPHDPAGTPPAASCRRPARARMSPFTYQRRSVYSSDRRRHGSWPARGTRGPRRTAPDPRAPTRRRSPPRPSPRSGRP